MGLLENWERWTSFLGQQVDRCKKYRHVEKND